MSTESSEPNSAPGGVPNPVTGPPFSAQPPINSGQKAAATARRNKEERRAESLRQIRAQTADGTLVVRQMTVAQHEAASEVAREILARNEAGGKRSGARGKRER